MTVREPVTDQAPPATLTMLDVADLLFPNPGVLHLRMVVEGLGSSAENYHWRRRGAWREVGPFPHDKEPSPLDLIAENLSARVRFSPSLTISPVASEIARFDTVSVAIPIPTVIPERAAYTDSKAEQLRARLRDLRSESRIDSDAHAKALALVRELAPQPTLLVDEGDRVVILWRLAEPVHEPAVTNSFRWQESRVVRLMHRLAMALSGDTLFSALPHTALIDCPGIKRDDVSTAMLPYHVVSATRLSHEPVALADLEAFVAEGAVAQAVQP